MLTVNDTGETVTLENQYDSASDGSGIEMQRSCIHQIGAFPWRSLF
ncbi:hypothetical protein [Rhizobium leguminosarum]